MLGWGSPQSAAVTESTWPVKQSKPLQESTNDMKKWRFRWKSMNDFMKNWDFDGFQHWLFKMISVKWSRTVIAIVTDNSAENQLDGSYYSYR